MYLALVEKMRKLIIAAIFFVSAISLQAQEPKARLVDEFGRVPCGDMMGRLDALLGEWMKNTEERVTVVYYNHRYPQAFKARQRWETHCHDSKFSSS